MKVKQIQFTRFKRFTNLRVEDIPHTARLVILAGPNGSGKSSFFDGLYSWYRAKWSRWGHSWNPAYHEKQLEEELTEGDTATREKVRGRLNFEQSIQVEFHDAQQFDSEELRKAVYVRSAYRNDPAFQISELRRVGSPLDEPRFERFTDNDATVSKNYQRLVSQGFRAAYKEEDPTITIGEFRKRTIGDIQSAMRRLFPDLVLNDFGDPLEDGTFFFDKGKSRNFSYQNLSGGEKAAFDLILDLIVKRKTYDNTVYCIDEPEAHMSTRLQGTLLDELFLLTPQNCQLWLATHSIGMMRRARDLATTYPNEVIFLDFSDIDFDNPVVLKPVVPTRSFWQRILHVALDDLSALVVPEQIIICEGAPRLPGGTANMALDADCYDKIFESEFPGAKFISAGNSSEVEGDRIALMEALRALAGGAQVTKLIDRDDHSPQDVADRRKRGVRVLTLRNLECYLFDDEVLVALCKNEGKPEKSAELLKAKETAVKASIARGNPADDIKSAAGEIYNAAKSILALSAAGNNVKSFMRTSLAPLVRVDMKVYQVLKADIFDK